ncbi:methyltransferase domain-containing protein [Patescibacteria group bacterium]|nr:methyltransferase domain-containing protein [Patescibacteria group bacterium]
MPQTPLEEKLHLLSTLPKKRQFLDMGAVYKEAGLTPGMIVADLGCGSGFLSFKAARIVGDNGLVYAVDVRRDVLGHIEDQKQDFGIRNLKTVLADLSVQGSTEIPEKSVDLVLLAKIIYQVSNTDMLFDEARRILKPEGKVLVIEWKKEKQPFGPPEEKRVSYADIKKIVRNVGFVIEKDIDAEPYHYGVLLSLGT